MTRLFLALLLFTFLRPMVYAQNSLNLSLKQELDSLLIVDQKYRAALIVNMQGKGDSLAIVYGVKKEDLENYLWKLQNEIDSLNTIRIEQIIRKHGYPGISLVGKPTNEVAFYIIQHSKAIDKFFPVIKKAADNKELSFSLYATMLDRSLMFHDTEQIYGTQVSGLSVKNRTTGNWDNLSFIWPIKDPSTVNERRKTAGFSETIEESAKSFGFEYKIFSLAQILKWRREAQAPTN